jgi:hypothetical protein
MHNFCCICSNSNAFNNDQEYGQKYIKCNKIYFISFIEEQSYKCMQIWRV